MVINSNPAPRYIGCEVISLRLLLEGKSGCALLRLPSIDFINHLLQSPGAARGAAYKLFKFSIYIVYQFDSTSPTYYQFVNLKMPRGQHMVVKQVNQIEWLYVSMFRWEPSPAKTGQTSGTAAGTVLP